MKHLFLVGVFFFTTLISYSQNTINLETCYEGLKANYPLVKQHLILEHQNETELSAIKTQTLPQLKLNAQATYQSDVTEVPIPNTGIEPLNNDQYRATLTANQLIYAGGKIKANRKPFRSQTTSIQKPFSLTALDWKLLPKPTGGSVRSSLAHSTTQSIRSDCSASET
jgi:hypothetical protein